MVDDNSVRQGALPEQVEGAQAREDKEIAASLRGCGKRPYASSFPLCNLPQRGELNTSGAERRSELTSLRGANQKGRTPAFAGCGKTFHEQIGFSASCQEGSVLRLFRNASRL